MLLSGVLFVLFLAGCWLYCLTDAALTPADEFPGWRKQTWIVVIAVTLIAGAIAWVIARRNWRAQPVAAGRRHAPDDHRRRQRPERDLVSRRWSTEGHVRRGPVPSPGRAARRAAGQSRLGSAQGARTTIPSSSASSPSASTAPRPTQPSHRGTAPPSRSARRQRGGSCRRWSTARRRRSAGR